MFAPRILEADMEMNSETPDRFIPLSDVRALLGGMSRATIFEMKRTGRFPPSVRVGRRALWVEREVRNWMREQVERRDTRTPEHMTAHVDKRLAEARSKRQVERKKTQRDEENT
jgi:prophage regulatory protein